jgi:hypothetical protein
VQACGGGGERASSGFPPWATQWATPIKLAVANAPLERPYLAHFFLEF